MLLQEEWSTPYMNFHNRVWSSMVEYDRVHRSCTSSSERSIQKEVIWTREKPTVHLFPPSPSLGWLLLGRRTEDIIAQDDGRQMRNAMQPFEKSFEKQGNSNAKKKERQLVFAFVKLSSRKCDSKRNRKASTLRWLEYQKNGWDGRSYAFA